MPSNRCCICNKPNDENNVLLDGRTYHSKCLSKIQSEETDWDSKISSLQEKIWSKKQEISKILNSRSLLQKWFGEPPEKINDIKNEIEIIREKVKKYKENQETTLRKRKGKLKSIYDYWPSRPPDWSSRIYELKRKFRYCENCGKHSNHNVSLQAHHIVPISKGGNHKFSNLQLLCYKCHNKEHKFDINSDTNSNKSQVHKNLEAINRAKNKNKYLKFKHRLYEKTYDDHIVKIKEIYRGGGIPRIKAYCYFNDFDRKFRLDKLSQLEILSEPPKNKRPADFIEEALEKGIMIHCHYTKRTGGRSKRTLKPIEYTTFKGVKVLKCFDFLTDEHRNFSPHRMKNIEIVKEPKEQKVITGKP